jgi:hypothetical protein
MSIGWIKEMNATTCSQVSVVKPKLTMEERVSSNAEQLATVEKILASVGNSIKREGWFKKGKWVVSTHPFPVKKPEAVTLHVSKPHWFNDKLGIHVETFLALDPKKRKKSYVAVHISHHDVIPKTKLKRIAISKPIVDSICNEVGNWDGYKFRAGKYGLQPFTLFVNGIDEKFPKIVTKEIGRVCQLVGPVIDRVLSEKL